MSRWLPLFLTTLGCMLLHIMIDKQHHLVVSLTHLQEALSAVHNEHARMKLNHYHVERSNSDLARTMEQQYQSSIEQYMHDITVASRSRMIRIKGIPEEEEDLESAILELLQYVGIQATRRDIERANRIGKEKANRTRIVNCELHSHRLKLLVLRQSLKLKNTALAIQDDLTNVLMPNVIRPEHHHDDHECGLVSHVGVPEEFVKMRKPFGAWFKDPLSPGDTIWVVEHFFKTRKFAQYESIEDLLANRKSKTINLKEPFGGTGHVVYNNSFYYNRYNTSLMVKLDLESGEYLHQELPNALFGNQAPYQPSAFTDFDFAIDEEGLWIIYSTAENTLDIVISKLDPQTLEVEATYKTNWRKKWAGNAFMACGVLYVLKKCDITNSFLNYAYDTHTKQWRHIKIPIELSHKHVSSLSYNHAEKRLYAWDQDYLVGYDIEFYESTARETWMHAPEVGAL